MQRRALAQAAATAAVLAVALAGCTGSDETTGAVDSQSGSADASSAPAPSGKYSTLPEPCTALSTGTLEELLPGTEEESEDSGESGESGEDGTEDAEEALAGKPDLTYDADRLVGCRWERESTAGGHKLELRFERIVSYDDEISDDEQAEQVYAERADEHGVDVASEAPDLPDKGGATHEAEDGGGSGDGTNGDDATDTANASDPSDTGTAAGDGDSPEAPGSPDSSDSSGSSDDGDDDPTSTLAPRLLDDIGDESFLDDRSGGAATGEHREVTVVFRTSNVVVTVTYDRWDTAATQPPDSAELQQRAQQVADQLADQLAG
ncbi:hypothetical protein [Streptomyces sp. MAR4 CNX-425]|uniref:hypothetical protein n=1 Tax=Streptomyces sp. MAR4 CNX-425 TaxID=3406343 RepID=UPI003B5044B7